MSWLLLFDVDGTLVSTGGAGSRAMALALEEMYGTSDGLMALRMAGKTDPVIFREAVTELRLPARDGDVVRFRERYFTHLARLAGRMPHGRVMPGVRELLEACRAAPGVYTGLLTGNWRQGARLKLSAFDLWESFGVGAFADDSEVRDELLPFAQHRLEKQQGVTLHPTHVVVVGDTPSDVQCARPHGAVALAVATGPYSMDDLAAYGPDYLVPTLPGAGTLQLLGIG